MWENELKKKKTFKANDMTFDDYVMIDCYLDCVEKLIENVISFWYSMQEEMLSDEEYMPMPYVKIVSNSFDILKTFFLKDLRRQKIT